ncbi:MAG: epoxyqueuosine reductase QueH [Calditerrivibrio sp.]|nr:epoxyqueuosine reductase QueH [Calditerrivibrio sp.]
MKKILLHQCCGPCSIYPIRVLKDRFQVVGYFYNPNIHPSQEFYRRLENTIIVNKQFGVATHYDEYYGLTDFFRFKDVSKLDRCRECYAMRLKNTAHFAKKYNFSIFSTTLLYSKYQNHEEIKALGERYAGEYGLEFYYEDFREGWKEGITLSKQMNIYRQQYCGCIYSEGERYIKDCSKKLPDLFDKSRPPI